MKHLNKLHINENDNQDPKAKVYDKEAMQNLTDMFKDNPDGSGLMYRYMITNHPNYADHDYYIYIANEEFKKNPDGNYRKVYEVEKFILMDDKTSLTTFNGMISRVKYTGSFGGDRTMHLYSMWLAKGMMESVADQEDYRAVYPSGIDEHVIEFFVENSQIII